MRGIEKAIVLWALAYMAIYIPFFFFAGSRVTPDQFLEIIIPLHLAGIVQNFLALALTIRDLYKRPFPNPNQKLTWCLLITWTGGIGWLVYIFKHALKPRPVIAETPVKT